MLFKQIASRFYQFFKFVISRLTATPYWARVLLLVLLCAALFHPSAADGLGYRNVKTSSPPASQHTAVITRQAASRKPPVLNPESQSKAVGSASQTKVGSVATQPNTGGSTSGTANSSTSGKAKVSSTPGRGAGNASVSSQNSNCASNPNVCGFPDDTNTGPSGCSSYTDMSGYNRIDTDNTVIECVRLTNGAFDVYANNVTIKNSIITANNWWGINEREGHSGLTVVHNTITGVVGQGPDNGGEDYAVSQGGSGGLEVGWNNISQFGDAISVGDGNVHDNYVHDLQAYMPLCGNSPCSTYQHSDDLIVDGNDKVGLTITHNTMFNQHTADHGASAAIGLFDDNGPVTNITVDNNLIAGGAYALYAGGATSSNIVVTNNHFSTIFWPASGIYGPDAYWHEGNGNLWSNNIWDDGTNMGQLINP